MWTIELPDSALRISGESWRPQMNHKEDEGLCARATAVQWQAWEGEEEQKSAAI